MNIIIGQTKVPKKVLSIALSLVMALGTFITFTIGYSPIHDLLNIRRTLSAYASDIVDTKGAIALAESEMLANDHSINLVNRDGSNTVYLFAEPISFTDDNGDLKTKDITIEKQEDTTLKSEGYEFTNGQNDYRINFSKDYNTGIKVTFSGGSFTLIPQSIFDDEGEEAVAEYLDDTFEVFQYKNIYGNGTNLRFYPQLNGIKDEIVLNQNINQHSFSFELYADNCTAVLNEDGTVSLMDENGDAVQTFSAPFAYDSEYIDGTLDNHRTNCEYALTDNGDGCYLLMVTVPDEWLNSEDTVYPVVIDPTTVNVDTFRDASVYSSYPNTCYGSEATACIGKSSTYGNGRVYLQFLWPSEIADYATINSAYVWMRETTGNTGSMYVQPYIVKSAWQEGNITWNNRPYMDATSDMPIKNINSQSTDWPSSPYWYKMYITSAVQKWSNYERPHYGIGLYSTAEESSSNNWRAFATIQHSTSSYKPYTVINYTNDSVTPTINDISKSPAGWTNQNVSFTVDAADSQSGISGYAFSNTAGDYTYQSSATSGSFATNKTVHIAVKDKAGNVTTTTRGTYIDKLAPPAPTVTGVPNDWTNQNITITVNSNDTAENSLYGKSGTQYYSCTTTENVYNWKTASSLNSNYNFTLTSGGTYYIYAKDRAGNVSECTEIMALIDKEAPTVNISTYYDTTTNNFRARIVAEDSASGIKRYKMNDDFDWIVLPEAVSSYEFDYALTSQQINVSVEDVLGNCQTKIETNDVPLIYDEYPYVGIMDKGFENRTVEYRIDDGEWTTYERPFAISTGEEITVYARYTNSTITSHKTFNYINYLGEYTENESDFTLIYNGLSFDFSRHYSSISKKWFYATDSFVDLRFNGYVYYAVLPDATNLVFEKIDDTHFENSFNKSILTLLDNGCCISYNSTNYFYGQDGKINSISDKYGNSISITRNANTVVVSDPTGRTYSIVYDSNNRIERIVDPNSNEINYFYGGAFFDEDYSNINIVVPIDYDAYTTITNQSGIINSIYFYKNNTLIKSMDKNILYENGVVTQVKYDSGISNMFSYENNKVIVTDVLNQSSYIIYDEYYFPIEIVDTEGKITQYEYNDQGRLVTVTGESIIENTYDTNGNLVLQEENAGENIRWFVNGQLVHKKEKDKHTYYEYNENGLLIISALLAEDYIGEIPTRYNEELECFITSTYAYDNCGRVLSITSINDDKKTKYTYDNYGNITRIDTYNADESIIKSNPIIYSYNVFNDITSAILIDSNNAQTLIEQRDYNESGLPVYIEKDGRKEQYVYDVVGRIIQLVDQDDIIDNNELTSDIGYRYVYNEKNQLISETNKYNVITTYEYYENGIMSEKAFDIYRFTYYPNGNLNTFYMENKSLEHYEYGNNNYLTNLVPTNEGDFLIECDNTPRGPEINRYNQEGVLLGRYELGSTTPYYSIDGIGDNSKSYIRWRKKLGYSDSYKVVYNRTDNSFGYSKTSGYSTSLVGQTNRTFEENDDYYYSYQSTHSNNCNEISETHFGLEYNSLDQNSQTTFIHNNNTVETILEASDESDGIVDEQIINNNNNILTATYDLTIDNCFSKEYDLCDYQFEQLYGDNGLIVQDENRQYQYNEYGALVSSYGNGYEATYSYDDRGNLISKTINGVATNYQYSSYILSKDRLISVNGVSVSEYNGNLSQFNDFHYSWSGSSLKTIRNYQTNTTIEYEYDENGVRENKTVNGITTYFDTMGGKVLAQSDGVDTFYFQYRNKTPIGFILNGIQFFYITNTYGDVAAITNSNGDWIAKYVYDDWGNVISISTSETNNPTQLEIATKNPLRYRGYYFDEETGFYYLQYRYYNPSWGRFISPDRSDYINTVSKYSINAYIYCKNNPVLYTDYTGLLSEAGQAISDFIGVLFITLDAQTILGDDFACFIASIFTINPGSLYFEFNDPGEGYSEEERQRAWKEQKEDAFRDFFDWYIEIITDFSQLMNSSFYKTVKLLKKDFFFEFFNQAVASKKMFAGVSVGGKLSISFGYGNADGFFSALNDLLNGHYKITKNDGMGVGVLLPPSKGIYVENNYALPNDFNANVGLEVSVDVDKLKLLPVILLTSSYYLKSRFTPTYGGGSFSDGFIVDPLPDTVLGGTTVITEATMITLLQEFWYYILFAI